jgi:hypothetical protein
MIIHRRKHNSSEAKGQIIMEFTFSMIIALLMLFSTMMIFRWAGYDLAWRRVDHDQKLTNAVVENFGGCLPPCTPREGPIEQIDPYFHRPLRMNATWGL